jgi:actin-like ATPase involved in cell morphogenesis
MVSRINPDTGRPEIIFGGESHPVPTAIHIDHAGKKLFGQEAVDESEHDRAGYFDGLKQSLGDPTSDYIFHGRPYSRMLLLSLFLEWIREKVEREILFEPVDHAVITIPALYGKLQRNDLVAAAQKAGFKCTETDLLDEPVAAGYAFLLTMQGTPMEKNPLVVDWGGGTLDIAVLEQSDGSIIAHGDLVGGKEDLGGKDIDEAILSHVDRWPEANGQQRLKEQPIERNSRIKRDLERCKQRFSSKESVEIRLILDKGIWTTQWDRGDFEKVITPFVEIAAREAWTLTQKACKLNIYPSQVLLVGGSSRLRLLEIVLKQQLNIEPTHWVDHREAVAYGAARMAHEKYNREPKPVKGIDINIDYQVAAELGSRAEINVEGKTIRFLLPTNFQDGTIMRLKGQGHAGTNGGEPGHLLITLHYSKDTPALGSLLSLTFSPPEYGIFIRIFKRDLIKNESDIEKTHFSFGADMIMTNNGSDPLNNMTLRLQRAEGNNHLGPTLVAKALDADERIRITMIDTEWLLLPGDQIEIQWHRSKAPLRHTVTKVDCFDHPKPLLPVIATWIPGAFTGKVLEITNVDASALKSVTVKTITGKATIELLSPNQPHRVGWTEFSDTRNLKTGEIIEINCAGYAPSVGIIVE